MGTKNRPTSFDAYSKADPDEPIFVLLGRDPCAWLLVLAWCWLRARKGEEKEIVREARRCAEAMRDWACKLGKETLVESYEKTFCTLMKP